MPLCAQSDLAHSRKSITCLLNKEMNEQGAEGLEELNSADLQSRKPYRCRCYKGKATGEMTSRQKRVLSTFS